ncbi:MAG: hypothetical protein JHC38_10755 [Thiotrichales bacterium]|jgi:hypothetical protein|nr:hypothetical protein [Thiotrichales bacterium]
MSKQTELSNIMPFYGINLIVVKHDSQLYVPLKPIVDLIGISWRNAKITAFSGDNVILYATKRLLSPQFASGGEDIIPQEAVYIALDRVYMYLAKTNTNKIKQHGNVLAAEYLLNLQIEWAKAIYQYETAGIAIKQGKSVAHRELAQLLRMRSQCKGIAEHNAIGNMIKDCFIELGQQMPEDPQQQLPLVGE